MNRKLKSIHLEREYFDDGAVIGLEGAIAISDALRVISSLSLKYLRMQVNRTLKSLHLSGNNIGDRGASVIGGALKVTCMESDSHSSEGEQHADQPQPRRQQPER